MAWLVISAALPCVAAEGIYLGSGVKAGEITDTSAIVHVRLTAAPQQDATGRIPGCEGVARLHFGLQESGSDDRTTPWATAKASEDLFDPVPTAEPHTGAPSLL